MTRRVQHGGLHGSGAGTGKANSEGRGDVAPTGPERLMIDELINAAIPSALPASARLCKAYSVTSSLSLPPP